MSGLRYVYGIVPASVAPLVDGAALTGIDDAPVRTIAEGPFAATTSELSDTEYAAETLNERIRDLDWLTPRAAAHQAVNERVLDIAGTVLPLSFGTLYRDDVRVREMLREDVEQRARRLVALNGRAEWIVTLTRESETTLGTDEVTELDREIASSTPGRAFLLEKRRATVAKAATERADAEAARRAEEALETVAERTYREPVARGGADTVVLRISLLAERSRT
ncbi:MAG TPA: GvpL/GvpF family gas vesicle protein, partial [Candidatus Limnocylindria bacterium]|nr:GvpL/GvpF family gas vesicle protein [Candidatus Limnocylindria bacterium]